MVYTCYICYLSLLIKFSLKYDKIFCFLLLKVKELLLVFQEHHLHKLPLVLVSNNCISSLWLDFMTYTSYRCYSNHQEFIDNEDS